MICVATRADGEPCQKHAVEGDERCAFHQDERVGNASKLTPETADQLVTLLQAGNYVAVACRAVGISRALFYSWLARGESDDPDDAVYVELRERVDKAKATAEARNVAAIATAARESWQAAAWLLERQYPERWGRVSVRMRDDQPDQPPQQMTDDPFAEVDELAERRERARLG